MAQPEAQERMSELAQEDRDRLAKIEVNQSVMFDQMTHLVKTVDDMGNNINKLVVSVTKNTESNHHIADRQDKTNDRLDKLEERTFGSGGLSDKVADLAVKAGISKTQIAIAGSVALVFLAAFAAWYFNNAATLSQMAEFTEAIKDMQ